MKYTEAPFKEGFGLTPLQAADYGKVFHHVQALLQQSNPLHKPMHRRFYAYETEAFAIVESLHGMGSKLKIATLLKSSFPGFAKHGSEEAAQTSHYLLSIRGSYIWPADKYDDWEKFQQEEAKKQACKCRQRPPLKSKDKSC